MLDFIYTVETPEIDKEEDAIELLVAADRFDCIQLKLFVESVLVEKFLKAGNAAALFLFADSHWCALLKEAATNRILDDADSVKKTPDWRWVRESQRLMTELLEASLEDERCSSAKRNRNGSTSTGDPDRWNVTSLRRKLKRAKLEVDGSREILVNRWKAHTEQTRAIRE